MDVQHIIIVIVVLGLIALVAHGLYSARRERAARQAAASRFSSEAVSVTAVDGEVSEPRTVSRATEASKIRNKPIFTGAPAKEPAANEAGEKPVKITIPGYQPKAELEAQAKAEAEAKAAVAAAAESAPVAENVPKAANEALADPASEQSTPQQMDLTIDAEETPRESEATAEQAAEPAPESKPRPKYLVLYVMAADGQAFTGAQITKALEGLGLLLNERNLYSYHFSMNPANDVIFRVANITKPGRFDIDNLEHFKTRGVTFFMQLDEQTSGNAITNFNMMLSLARQLADDLRGAVLNDRREPFDELSKAAYLDALK